LLTRTWDWAGTNAHTHEASKKPTINHTKKQTKNKSKNKTSTSKAALVSQMMTLLSQAMEMDEDSSDDTNAESDENTSTLGINSEMMKKLEKEVSRLANAEKNNNNTAKKVFALSGPSTNSNSSCTTNAMNSMAPSRAMSPYGTYIQCVNMGNVPAMMNPAASSFTPAATTTPVEGQLLKERNHATNVTNEQQHQSNVHPLGPQALYEAAQAAAYANKFAAVQQEQYNNMMMQQFSQMQTTQEQRMYEKYQKYLKG
jgi:hypothetical protein